MNSAKRQVK